MGGSLCLASPVFDQLEALETGIVAPSRRSKTDIRFDHCDGFSAILNEILITVTAVLTRDTHITQACEFIALVASASSHDTIRWGSVTEFFKGSFMLHQGLGLAIVDLVTTALGLNNGEQARDGSEGGEGGELHSGKVLRGR